MSNKTLNEIALGTNTDKATSFVLNGERRKAHGYALIYDRLLTPLRKFAQSGKRKINLLEIGVGENPGGASLQMWAEYFGLSNSNIYALDYRQEAVDMVNGWGEPYQAYYCDQGNYLDLEVAKGIFEGDNIQFDAVIDDGSHKNNHIMMTFEKLFPLVREGGFYIIEDLQEFFNGKSDALEYFKNCIDHQYEEQTGKKFNEVMEIRFWNQVVIIRKGKLTNTYGDFHTVED